VVVAVRVVERLAFPDETARKRAVSEIEAFVEMVNLVCGCFP
jgi:hypothetical protein